MKRFVCLLALIVAVLIASMPNVEACPLQQVQQFSSCQQQQFVQAYAMPAPFVQQQFVAYQQAVAIPQLQVNVNAAVRQVVRQRVFVPRQRIVVRTGGIF